MYHHEFSCSLVHFLSFFPVHFKNVPEYLTRGTALVFIPLMRFMLYSLIWRSFLVFMRYYLNFFHPSCFQYSPVLVIFLFSASSDFFLIWFPSLAVFWFSLLAWHIFLCQIHPYIMVVYHHCLYFPILFSFLANSFMSSMYIRWWIFFAIYIVFILLYISWIYDLVASLLLQIVMLIMHIPGTYLSGFLRYYVHFRANTLGKGMNPLILPPAMGK